MQFWILYRLLLIMFRFNYWVKKYDRFIDSLTQIDVFFFFFAENWWRCLELLEKSIETCEQAWNFALPYFRAGWAKFQVCLHVAKSPHVKRRAEHDNNSERRTNQLNLADDHRREPHVFHEHVFKKSKTKTGNVQER